MNPGSTCVARAAARRAAHRRFAFALGLAALAPAASGQDFDWALLDGQWAESSQQRWACRPDNRHQRLAPSRDRRLLVFANDRKWKLGTGQEVEQYAAAIVRSGAHFLVIRYGSDIPGIPDELREWELRFVGPGTYRWRATSWPEGQYNDVIGVRCAP
jgi:hypothetical protein